jgi:hypothetical protein
MLRAVTAATATIDVGLGVVPMDSYPARDLRLSLTGEIPVDRVILGVGAGYISTGARHLVEDSIQELRQLDGPLRIAVGGYGPLILRAAGRFADALCLAWMTPERLHWALSEVAVGAVQGERAVPPTYLYVRSATGHDAEERIYREMAEYGKQPHHVRHQAAMAPTMPVGITVQRRQELDEALAAFEVEFPVIRGLPVDPDDADEWLAIAELFAPIDSR